jgi:hypothetical protein
MLKLELEKHPKLDYPIFVLGPDPENPDRLWEIKDDLKQIKFKYFAPRKIYNKNAKYIQESDIEKLKSLDVDVSIYYQFKNSLVDMGSLRQEDVEKSKHAPALKDQFEFIIQKIQQSRISEEDRDSQLAMIEGLRSMAEGTNEAAKQAFIIDFLRFSKNFYNYSWYNTMLIWLQMKRNKLDATHTRGAKQWEKLLGRKVLEDHESKGATILAPQFKKDRVDKPELEEAVRLLRAFVASSPSKNILSNPDNVVSLIGYVRANAKNKYLSRYINHLVKENKFLNVSRMAGYIGKKIVDPGYDFKDAGNVVGFKGVTVYDVSQTEELTGEELEEYKKRTGNEPFRPIPREAWLGDEEEDPDTEEGKAQLQEYIDGMLDFASSMKVEIKFEDTGNAGGWSAIGSITMDQNAKGVTLLKTLIHEMAHEMIHTKETRRGARGKEGSFNLEVDAEAVAFAVMTSMGFNANSTYNYLALWAAKGKSLTPEELIGETAKVKTVILTRLSENFKPILDAALKMVGHLEQFVPELKAVAQAAMYNLHKMSYERMKSNRRPLSYLRTPREAFVILESMMDYFRSTQNM